MNSCASTRSDTQATSSMGGVVTEVPIINQPTSPGQTKILTVFAAASLVDAFRDISKDFEASRPGVRVHLGFAGTQILRTQIEQGAVADVFASADQKNMDLLVSEGLISEDTVQDFATNRLVVILPPGNPAGVHTLKDLSRPNLKIILADISVPAGQYAQAVLANLNTDQNFGVDYSANVLRNVVSYETDVRQVVAKIELSEADVGIVYASDAVAAPNLLTIPIPDQFNIIARYPIGVLSNSSNPDLGSAFIDYVNSTAGQATLQKWGFSTGR